MIAVWRNSHHPILCFFGSKVAIRSPVCVFQTPTSPAKVAVAIRSPRCERATQCTLDSWPNFLVTSPVALSTARRQARSAASASRSLPRRTWAPSGEKAADIPHANGGRKRRISLPLSTSQIAALDTSSLLKPQAVTIRLPSGEKRTSATYWWYGNRHRAHSPDTPVSATIGLSNDFFSAAEPRAFSRRNSPPRVCPPGVVL